MDMVFESFVNSERCKTNMAGCADPLCLRALLIQKDVKQAGRQDRRQVSLRALLIQKDVKLNASPYLHTLCLRALLIQKDVKRI